MLQFLRGLVTVLYRMLLHDVKEKLNGPDTDFWIFSRLLDPLFQTNKLKGTLSNEMAHE